MTLERKSGARITDYFKILPDIFYFECLTKWDFYGKYAFSRIRLKMIGPKMIRSKYKIYQEFENVILRERSKIIKCVTSRKISGLI